MADKRRVMLIREPLGGSYEVADKLAEIGDILGVKVDEIADTAYIVIESSASEYALLGIAHGWRIWRGPRRAVDTRQRDLIQ
jgi:hypothetical protein